MLLSLMSIYCVLCFNVILSVMFLMLLRVICLCFYVLWHILCFSEWFFFTVSWVSCIYCYAERRLAVCRFADCRSAFICTEKPSHERFETLKLIFAQFSKQLSLIILSRQVIICCAAKRTSLVLIYLNWFSQQNVW